MKQREKFNELRDFLYISEQLNAEQTLHIMTKCRKLFSKKSTLPEKQDPVYCERCHMNTNYDNGSCRCGNKKIIPSPSLYGLEEIEEINLTQIFLINMSLSEKITTSFTKLECFVNQLIRNQNIIVKKLKSL